MAVYVLLFKQGEHEEDETMLENRFLQSNLPAIHRYSAGESAEALTLMSNKVGKQLLAGYLGCNVKRNDRSYVVGIIMSIPTIYD